MQLPNAPPPAPCLRLTFLRAVATCLLNPKAYLFLLAVFPQFIGPGQYRAARIAAMAVITAATQGAVYGAVAVTAGTVQQRLRRHPGRMRWLVRVIGIVLIITACAMLASGHDGRSILSYFAIYNLTRSSATLGHAFASAGAKTQALNWVATGTGML